MDQPINFEALAIFLVLQNPNLNLHQAAQLPRVGDRVWQHLAARDRLHDSAQGARRQATPQGMLFCDVLRSTDIEIVLEDILFP